MMSVEGRSDLLRDTRTNALLYNENNETHKINKILRMENEIHTMKNDISSMKTLLERLVNGR